ncbi:DUF4132 domain-containing protein [uncultured Aquimarina sp.]|uniref:DUF4132 domain-containing protein n=1 Tax=uncultured Aquimarina sp. TaxID=575652 RepID=UPI002635B2E4|nr:DUF4132 domain-containing protein [uncultured Aquimarina sp.]
MGIKESFGKLFRKEAAGYTKNPVFEELLDNLMNEAYEKNQYGSYVMLTSFSKLNSYQTIKSKSSAIKKQLTLYLINPINNYVTKAKKQNSYSSNDVAWRKRYVYSELFQLLMRSNLGFTEEDIIRLLKDYKTSDEANVKKFVDWPIGFTVQQIERIVKKEGLTTSFGVFLKEVLTWPQLKQTKYYYGTDLEKVRVKIEKILFEGANEEGRTPPYALPDDRLAAVINPEITELSSEDRDHWYALFHLFAKVTGSKPSQKFSKSSSQLVDQIGIPSYKSRVHTWLEFAVSLKEIEKQHSHTYDNGHVYNYSSYEFVHEKNLLFLKGLVWSMAKFHDSKTLDLVAKLTDRSFKKIPGVGPTAAGVGNACIYVLGNTRGLEGISHLSRLKLKIKQNNTKKLIEKYIETSSEKLGVSTAEVEELSIPDFGLTLGAKSYMFDEYTLQLTIEGLGKVALSWIKPDGKTQKSVPSFVKDSAKHKLLLKKAKDDVAQIKKYSSAQRDRIDRSYLHDRVWTYESFEKFYHNHGLVSYISRDLIWQFELDGTYQSALYHEDQWTDVQGTAINTITNETKVRLWHPIYVSIEEVVAWRNRLENLEIKQTLKQAYREVYILTDAEITTKTYSNRMAAHLLKQHQFNALTAIRGWRYSLLGCYDDGRDGEVAKIPIKTHGLEAQFWINEIYADDAFNDAGIWDYVATDQVRFIDTTKDEVVDLIDVDKIVFSEIMRDVDLFVGVASVGNDPEWRDNGGLPQYRDYWTSFSFGELTEVAKTRKDILEKIVPRLKINKVASIEGKFLRIKGTKRTYKIHIGSTNILMEPNDQYLCIVPARGKDKNTDNIFLPFEGDKGLSVVLSKAFLLAEDDKITDTTILSQIRR